MSDVSKILDAATRGSVTFMGETAGYKNAVGSYKIAADGTIYDVKILFANASLVDSGGDLVASKSSADFAMGATDKVGFFVVPDAFSQSTASLLSSQTGSFKFVDAKGNPGNVNGGVELKLEYVSESGKVTDVKSAYGTSVFHSVDDGSKGLNGDGLVHVKTTTAGDGSVTVGFEDLKGGGDKDYDDAVFKFTPSEASKALSAAAKAATDAPFKASGELLVDGSFEQSKAGADSWTHASSVGGWHSDTEIETWGKGFYGLKAAEGDKFAELDYDSSGKLSNIYQDVKTESGAEYTFTFDYMKRPDSPKGSDTINVFWNGNLVGSVDPTKSEWSGASFKVVGTGGSDRIEFRESANQNDSYGGLIDNASLKKSGASAAEKEAAVKTELEKAIAEKAAKEAADKAAAEKAAKEAADKAAAEKAAKEAADKAAAEAAAKEAADKAAAEAAAKEAADKAAAEAAAKEAADKAAAEAAAKEAADKAAAEKAAKEAADKAAAEKAAKEAADKAAAEKAAKEAADKAAAEAAAKEAADKAAAEAAAKEAADKAAAEKAAKEAADKAAAEAAAKEAADKAAAEAAAKEAADKAAAEKAAKEAADKAAAEAAAKEAADKAAAEAAAKEAADKAAAEAAAKEAADKAAAEAAAKEAADKAAAEAAAKEAADKAAWEAAHAEKLVLAANDANDSVLSSKQVGTDVAEDIKGATGSDAIYGKGGNDLLVASNAKMSSLKLPIEASLLNAADASAFEVTVSGMPKGATLSAGHDNGDGSWTLGSGELKDLVISTDAASDFALKVTASAMDGSGLSQAAEVTVHVPAVAHNVLSGGAGSDIVLGSHDGNDYLYGGSIPTGASSPAHVATAADNDVIVAGNGNNHVWGNSGDDRITAGNGDNWISGGKGNDFIKVGSGDNEIYGNTGDDRIVVGAGHNVVYGGEGFDTLDFRQADGVTVDVKAHTATFNGGGVTTFDSVEAFAGSSGNDIFLAGKKGEVFSGNGGDDTFVFSRGDVVSKGVALGPHEITDFGAGDTLDLRGVFAGHDWQGLDKMVQLVEDEKGTHVYAKVSQAMVEVTVLDNFHGHTVAEMVKDGSLLV